MPKPPIAVVIRRSRLSLGSKLLLWLGLASYAAWWIGPRTAVVVALVGVGLAAWRYSRTPPRRYLRCEVTEDRACWESSSDGRIWQAESCRLVRLAPLLSAIDLSGRRLWLWPDSSDANSLRQLRETLAGPFDESVRLSS